MAKPRSARTTPSALPPLPRAKAPSSISRRRRHHASRPRKACRRKSTTSPITSRTTRPTAMRSELLSVVGRSEDDGLPRFAKSSSASTRASSSAPTRARRCRVLFASMADLHAQRRGERWRRRGAKANDVVLEMIRFRPRDRGEGNRRGCSGWAGDPKVDTTAVITSGSAFPTSSRKKHSPGASPSCESFARTITSAKTCAATRPRSPRDAKGISTTRFSSPAAKTGHW